MRSKITRHFYNDHAHGWLKAPYSDLIELGIQNNITRYSYQRVNKKGEKFVYLEEDCDFTTYVNALKEKGITLNIKEHFCDERSSIRSYDDYCVA